MTFRRNGSLISGNHISYTDYKGNDTIFGRLGFWVESPGSGTSQFRVYSGTNIKMTVGAAGQVYLLNDSNTYWYHPANDTHAFTTAGDEKDSKKIKGIKKKSGLSESELSSTENLILSSTSSGTELRG